MLATNITLKQMGVVDELLTRHDVIFVITKGIVLSISFGNVTVLDAFGIS